MDRATAAALMATIRAAFPRLPKDDDAIGVWATALEGCDDCAAADAVITLLRERSVQPTPADIWRVVRERRARDQREEKPDPRAHIPMHEAAATILSDLTARMRADGRIPRKSSARA